MLPAFTELRSQECLSAEAKHVQSTCFEINSSSPAWFLHTGYPSAREGILSLSICLFNKYHPLPSCLKWKEISGYNLLWCLLKTHISLKINIVWQCFIRSCVPAFSSLDYLTGDWLHLGTFLILSWKIQGANNCQGRASWLTAFLYCSLAKTIFFGNGLYFLKPVSSKFSKHIDNLVHQNELTFIIPLRPFGIYCMALASEYAHLISQELIGM